MFFKTDPSIKKSVKILKEGLYDKQYWYLQLNEFECYAELGATMICPEELLSSNSGWKCKAKNEYDWITTDLNLKCNSVSP